MSASENILERVRRLLALAESSNVHEAAAAAAKAQELMTKHRIEQAELEVGAVAEEPILVEDLAAAGRSRQPWRELVANALAECNGCDVYARRVRAGRRKWNHSLHIVGSARSSSLVRYMFAYLTREVLRLGEEEARNLRELDGLRTSTPWHNSFRLGAAAALSQRIREAHAAAQIGASGTALARIDRDAERVAAHMPKTLNAARPARSTHSAAFLAGVEAGDSISLDQGAPALSAGASGALRSGT